MQEDKIPKIFISYSWSSEDVVVPLAQRLVSHGVDVVLDKWDLKEGQDKYAFMEQCVNDPEITKVLIVCDKKYADKANAREGGVGDETVIISQEVYGNVNQEKFIPVVLETDEAGDPYVPTYINTRIYIDLSDEEKYESEYEKLLRNIYEKPLYKKQKLGKRPEWLDEEKTNLFPLTDLVRQLKGSTSLKIQQSCVNAFVDEYINTLKTYFIKGVTDGEQVYKCFLEMKPIRDIFLDFIPVLAETMLPFSDTVCNIFEKMYNTLTCAKGFDPNAYSASDNDYEIYHLHIWELFICVIAYLRHVQDYRIINEILTNTYFLASSSLDSTERPTNYCQFRYYSCLIEDQYKPKTEYENKLTLLGHVICHEREKLPIFTGEAIAEADLFLYQVRNALELTENEYFYGASCWFPTCYVYVKTSPSEWTRLKSRKFCQKMFLLFGVTDLDTLKERISKCEYDRGMKYSGSIRAATAILSVIKLDEIGTLN